MSRPLTFDRFHRAVAGPLAPDRLDFFYLLPAEDQESCWHDVAERCERHNELLRKIDPLFDSSLRGFAGVDAEKRAAAFAPRRREVRPRHLRVVPDEDILQSVSPREYVEALTGQEVPPSGMVRCPFHEDRTPSLQVYEDTGWYAFCCHRGGDIYNFGAALFDLGTRGSDFTELRRRLASALLGREAA